jgi:hypothetical protein
MGIICLVGPGQPAAASTGLWFYHPKNLKPFVAVGLQLAVSFFNNNDGVDL